MPARHAFRGALRALPAAVPRTPNTTDCGPTRPPSGPKWASIKTGLVEPISAIAVAQGNSDIIRVGYKNGDVYKTTDGTADSPAWDRLDEAGNAPLPERRSASSPARTPARPGRRPTRGRRAARSSSSSGWAVS